MYTIFSLFFSRKHLKINYVMQAIADDSGGPVVQKVTNALIDMEHSKPGSSELFVTKLLHQLARSIGTTCSHFSFFLDAIISLIFLNK